MNVDCATEGMTASAIRKREESLQSDRLGEVWGISLLVENNGQASHVPLFERTLNSISGTHRSRDFPGRLHGLKSTAETMSQRHALGRGGLALAYRSFAPPSYLPHCLSVGPNALLWPCVLLKIHDFDTAHPLLEALDMPLPEMLEWVNHITAG